MSFFVIIIVLNFGFFFPSLLWLPDPLLMRCSLSAIYYCRGFGLFSRKWVLLSKKVIAFVFLLKQRNTIFLFSIEISIELVFLFVLCLLIMTKLSLKCLLKLKMEVLKNWLQLIQVMHLLHIHLTLIIIGQPLALFNRKILFSL